MPFNGTYGSEEDIWKVPKKDGRMFMIHGGNRATQKDVVAIAGPEKARATYHCNQMLYWHGVTAEKVLSSRSGKGYDMFLEPEQDRRTLHRICL